MYWRCGRKLQVAEKSHAFSRDVPERFERDMGYNESEFHRILPAAIGDYHHLVDGKQITVSHPDNNHQLVLMVTPLPDRVLGAFRIQRIDVQFAFYNMDANTRSTFMQHFDRRYQRGGG